MAEHKQNSKSRQNTRTVWAAPPHIAGATGVPGDFAIVGDAPVHSKLGRNEPCWCGSGKKYKHCHLESDLK